MAEGIRQLRAGEVVRKPGFDGRIWKNRIVLTESGKLPGEVANIGLIQLRKFLKWCEKKQLLNIYVL